MRFVQGRGSEWLLVGGDRPGNEGVLATLRSEVEVLALKEFCSYFSSDPSRVPEQYTIIHGDKEYTVVPLGGLGEKLTLLIRDGSHAAIRVETGLILQAHGP